MLSKSDQVARHMHSAMVVTNIGVVVFLSAVALKIGIAHTQVPVLPFTTIFLNTAEFGGGVLARISAVVMVVLAIRFCWVHSTESRKAYAALMRQEANALGFR